MSPSPLLCDQGSLAGDSLLSNGGAERRAEGFDCKSTVDKTDDGGSGHSFPLSLSLAQSPIPVLDAVFLFPKGMPPPSTGDDGGL